MDDAEFKRLARMQRRAEELSPTSHDLLKSLRKLEDGDTWRRFFEIYWPLIYRAATQAGFSDSEAEEVVQETIISVSRRMETYRYEPERCSFKGWLMHLTRGHIRDRLRRHQTRARWLDPLPLEAAEEIADESAEHTLDMLITEEWQNHLLNQAVARVKPTIGLRHYEIYVLRCVRKLPVREVCNQLKVSPFAVYLVTHRLVRKLRREVQRLQEQGL
jgi:RNA polymerase sigma-70 factor (ECF subfamily)